MEKEEEKGEEGFRFSLYNYSQTSTNMFTFTINRALSHLRF